MFSLSWAFNNSIRNKVIVETEIAGLRSAVGQYNVIQTLLYKSVAPIHKSAHVVECPPQLGKLTLIRITIWQGSLEVNTSTDLVLTCSVLFHADRFHWNDHNPCIFVLKGTKLKIKKFSPSAIVFVRASLKCSLVWPSGWLEVMICSYRGIHLLWWQLKWTRGSWFHFDILKKNLRWCCGHGPQGEGRGILLVGVASPSAVETFFISLREN